MTDEARNNGSTSDGRDERGRFTRGNPGRPPGARHRTTRAVEALLAGEAEAVTRRLIEAAIDGDMQAARLVIERIVPRRTDAPVTFDLPQVETSADMVAASAAILDAVAAGDITPNEAQAVAGLLQAHGRVLELHDLEERVRRLEGQNDSA